MDKIIIHNDVGCDELALNVVSEVMKLGKISNDGNQYCYATVFAQGGERIICTCDWNKKNTFTFKVYISEEINNDNRNESKNCKT